MTNQNNAAQAAEQDPLSDQFVNAVIRQHGYDSHEAVIARLWQWIGLNGSENGVTLLMYEAHKALVKLRAPVADDLVASLRSMASVAPASECEILLAAASALASAPVAGEATYYAVMHGNALYGVFDSEAAAEACKAQGHPDAPFSVKPLYAAPQASEADGLIDALGQCRDAFPIPDKVGSKLDLLWQEAMSDPTAVPEYVKLCAALSAQPGAQKEQSDA